MLVRFALRARNKHEEEAGDATAAVAVETPPVVRVSNGLRTSERWPRI
jgi:hypothetical protein